MRLPRHSTRHRNQWTSRAWVLTLCVLVSVLVPHALRAQVGNGFLISPVGARAVGQGDAVVADTLLGTEAMWWNPALLARLPKREVAVHHAQSIVFDLNMIALAVPSKILGTLAFSGTIADYGSLPYTDPTPGAPSGGSFGVYNYLLAAAYATPMGKRFNAGVTYKFIMFRSPCSGYCGPTWVDGKGSTSAIDLGAQYLTPTRIPVSLGLAIRNIGPDMQVKDAAQADPLPRIVQAGARVQIPMAALERNRASLELSADAFSTDGEGKPALGVGATLGYRQVLFFQGGYKKASGLDGGPSIGVGFRNGGFGVDIARRFDPFSRALSAPPTYVMLRARF